MVSARRGTSARVLDAQAEAEGAARSPAVSGTALHLIFERLGSRERKEWDLAAAMLTALIERSIEHGIAAALSGRTVSPDTVDLLRLGVDAEMEQLHRRVSNLERRLEGPLRDVRPSEMLSVPGEL